MDEKSFYDLNYIIEINEQRVDQYTTAYQKVLERLTHIILVYSAIAIFLIPLIQDLALNKIRNFFFILAMAIFLMLLVISVIFTIRLILPIKVAYLSSPRKYYEDYREQYEKTVGDKSTITNLLKGSYVRELQEAVQINQQVFVRKSSFFYNALIFALLSVIPYLACLGFHITYKEDIVQKVQIVNARKMRNFMGVNSKFMPEPNDANQTNSTSTTTETTRLPGIDNTQVISSHPNLIKENSQHISNKEDSQHIPKLERK